MHSKRRMWQQSVLLLVGLWTLSTCSAASASHVPTPTFTPIPTEATATATGSAAPTPSTTVVPTATNELCSGLDPFFQAVQNGALEGIGFNFTAPEPVLIKGTFSHYSATPAPTISGTGYMIAPTNDPVQAQLTRAPSSVTVTMDDTTTHHSITYTVMTCMMTLTNQLTLTGMTPQPFTLTLLNMQ